MKSYYQASKNLMIEQGSLEGEVRAEVCVIGGGYTGLSSALYLAKKGINVALLEANNLASGASGTNGGQVSGGMRRDQFYLERTLGKSSAKALWKIGEKAKAHVKELINEYGIECDFKYGIAHPNHKKKFCDESMAYVEYMKKSYDHTDIDYVDDSQMRELTGSQTFFGGSYDKSEAHLHPLNYALGIATAALDFGATIFENSRVLSYKNEGDLLRVQTQKGCIVADRIVLACNGYLENLEKKLTSKILPLNNYIIATKPLSEKQANRINPNDIAFADSRFVVNYFRLSADKRLLFGGGENFSKSLSGNILPIVTRPMEVIYPFLKGVQIDYAWGGKLAITLNRLPFFKSLLGDKVLSAQGYSGQGVALASYAGKIIADKIYGTGDMFDAISKIPTPSFPGGRLLRGPSMKIGMAYYALLDRL
ncbi:MAG: FAD-binding oxidoreductase [Gammaproteobacteria bacterium]